MSPLVSAFGDDPVAVALDVANMLPNQVAQWAETEPDRPFLVQAEDGGLVTYGEFALLVRRWISLLRELGVGSGHRVASFLPSSIEAQALWLATSQIGAFEVPVNPELRGEFLRHVLVDAEISLAVVRPESVELVSGLGGIDVLVADFDRSAVDGVEPFADWRRVEPDEVSCVIYTSGTTGPAKGVVITWAQMATSIGRIPREWLDSDDAVYAPWPMFHVTGRSPMISMVDVGGRVVLRQKFSEPDFWSDIQRHRCTSTTAGAVLPLLLAAPPQVDDADNPLRLVLLGRIGRNGWDFLQRFDVTGLGFYGSTEVGFPIANRPITAETLDVAGWTRPGYRARVVDADGHDVADGEVGELLIQPPDRRLILQEYLGQPARTAQAVVDGWYRTGDAVSRRDDGGLVFLDRMNDTIRRFGENISATALEDAIREDADVLECACIGVASDVAGQEIHLLAVAAEGSFIDPAALSDRLADRLPRYMRPSFISVVDELPKTPTNKIRKADLGVVLASAAIWSRP